MIVYLALAAATAAIVAVSMVAVLLAAVVRIRTSGRVHSLHLAMAAGAPPRSGPRDPNARDDDAPRPAPVPSLPVQGTHDGGRPGYHTADGGTGLPMARPAGWPDYAAAGRGGC